MSHHPPISRFLIISSNNTWKFHGYYEYTAKIKSLTGNTAGGQFKGPNIIEFINPLNMNNNDRIVFNYPSSNIHGLMYGRRIMEWEGNLEFIDEKNKLTATLSFTPSPKFYQKFKEPNDTLRGEIKQNDKHIHKIYGSPLDKLMFDEEM
jgi:hypothetical protein